MPFLGLSNSNFFRTAPPYIHAAIGRFSQPRKTICTACSHGTGLVYKVGGTIETSGPAGGPRVTRTFCLECIARCPHAGGRPSNWLHRRFDRAVLPRPLETEKGAPCGRRGMAEGGRTAPTALVVISTGACSLAAWVLRLVHAILVLPGAEDRAPVGTVPSAAARAEDQGRSFTEGRPSS